MDDIVHDHGQDLVAVAVVEAKMDKSDLNHSYNFDRQAIIVIL